VQTLLVASRRFFSAWVLAAAMAVRAVSWSSYRSVSQRRSFLWELHRATFPILPWFLVTSFLMSLVIVRLVIVTAESYDLSQYSLQVLVKSLVLELVPLFSALVVAMRYSLPRSQQIQLEAPAQAQLRAPSIVLAGAVAMLFFTLLSCVGALLISYLMLYGLTPWGLPSYTHQVGKIFTPATSMVFSLKALMFCGAVTLVPMASALGSRQQKWEEEEVLLRMLTRIFLVLLLVEILSLIAIYL
jgi:phospholipid/cholesterol/gamma-HCH transport system permease protein